MHRVLTYRSSRLAVAVVASLTLAACGGDADRATPPDPDASTETITAPPATDDPGTDDGSAETGRGLRAPTPIEVVSGGAGAAATESASAADVATSDMRIAPFVAEYVVSGDMPPLPTSDQGFVYDASTEPTPDQVIAVGSVFGVDGEPELVDEGYGANYRIGPDDGSAPSVWVYDDAQLSWNFNAPWADGDDVPCVTSTDADGAETTDCPVPTPPDGVPSGDEAEQLARDLLSGLGVDTTGLELDTYADEWFASVQVSAPVADASAGRFWSFGFGGNGVLQYAGGSLADPEPVGPYPLVDLDTAVARLGDGFYGGFGGGIATDLAVSDDVSVATESESGSVGPAHVASGDDGAGGEGSQGSVDTVLDEPIPVEPPVDLEPVTVTLVDVRPDLWWAWDADGSAWLLPAYRFIDTDGGWHVVPAVTDEFLIRTEPTPIEPMPAPARTLPPGEETLPAEPIETEGSPGDAISGDPTIPADTDSSTPVDVQPGTDPQVAVSLFDEYVGLTLDEFTKAAEQVGYSTRVHVQDGESLPVTMDYRGDRVNVAVDGDTVVSVDSIG